MKIASEILKTLGGNKFLAMTGCYNLMSSANENYLTMKLRRNSSKASHIRITLNSLDLYDVEFLKCSKNGIKTVKEVKGIYNDMLVKCFETNTGLYTSL